MFIPVTQIMTEATFSKSNLVMKPIRSNLTGVKLSKTMFIDLNYDIFTINGLFSNINLER